MKVDRPSEAVAPQTLQVFTPTITQCYTPDVTTDSTALALSGGGFRATLYHIGGLWRLNELGWLPRLSAVSGCSGGAITTAWLGLNWPRLDIDQDGTARNFRELIAGPLLRLCRGNHDVWPSLANMGAMLVGLHANALEGAYRRHLYGSATLHDLPEPGAGPRFYFCTSNLVTGSEVHFSREEVRDGRLGALNLPATPLARIVAASCAFPPFLSPCVIRTDPAGWETTPGADLYPEEALRRRMVLTDGGIHDPLALEPIRNHGQLLISDATVTREVWRKTSSFWIRQLGRTTILQTMANSRRVARAMVEAMQRTPGAPRVVHWGNANRIDTFGIADPLARDTAVTAALGELRTRLNRFTPAEQGRLVNWGYATCDAALRSGPSPEASPGTLPIPEHRLD